MLKDTDWNLIIMKQYIFCYELYKYKVLQQTEKDTSWSNKHHNRFKWYVTIQKV